MRRLQPNLIWMTFILLLAMALGSQMLIADIIFADEYWSIRNSGGVYGPLDIAGIWERTATVDPGGMGVLYHGLLGAWGSVIGFSVFSMRAFSLLFGVLSVAGIYRLGHDVHSKQVGLYAACILASSAFYIDYMHEARAYTLLAFLAIVTTLCYVRIMYRTSPENAHIGWYLGLSLGLASLAYTHYVALAMGLILGLVHLLYFQNSRRWWIVVLAMAIGGLLFLPWLNITLSVIENGVSDASRQDNSMTTVEIIKNWLHTISNANIALLVLTLLYTLRKFSRRVAIIWIWAVVGLFAVVLVNSFVPFMLHLRYLIFSLPAIALLVAIGITRLRQFALPILVVWVGAGIYQTVGTDFIEEQFGHIYRAPAVPFHQGLDVLNQRAQTNDLALLHVMRPSQEHIGFFPLDYYFKESGLVTTDLQFEQFERVGNSFAGGDVDYLADVETAFTDVDTIWTMVITDLPMTQRSGVIDYVLATQYTRCETVITDNDMLMELWVQPSEAWQDLTTFGDDIVLYDLARGTQSDDSLQVVLGGQAENSPLNTYSIGLHVFDETGNLVAQNDFGLPQDRPFFCISASVDLSSLPADNYTLRATIYAWQTGDRLLTAINGNYVDVQQIVID